MDRRAFLTTTLALPSLLRAQAEEGFTSLFDGKTLSGWTVHDGPETAFYVADGAIVVHESSGFPAWLRSAKQYENFDFRGEFFIKGWMDSGIYIHAPEHGRPMWNGMQIHLFQQVDAKPAPESMGAIFPLVAPLKVNVRNKGEWNTFRIVMDWPRLRVWTNDEVIQDLDVSTHPELRHRFRSGYLGFESLSYPIRFRNLRVRELPGTDRSEPLYTGPEDADKWVITEGKPSLQFLGGVIHTDGNGQFGTKEKFRDFELRMFVRHVKHHNSGVMFRGGAGPRRYEIQLHDVEGAHYPTGSLYGIKRSVYPKIEAEAWFPFQLIVQDRRCLVRVNGDTVLEYDGLENLAEGPIELQAHAPGKWTEFKQIRVKRLGAPETAVSASVAGTWKASYSTPDGYRHESTIELQPEGTRLRGKISSRRGTVEITDGTVANDRVVFRVVRRGNGDELDVGFTGRVDKDVMKLVMEYRDHDPVSIVARRETQK
jgi:hypothetical protein